MRDRIFYAICFGLISGVLLRSFIVVDFHFLVLAGIIAAGLFLYFQLVSKNKWGVIGSVFLFFIVLGIARFQARETFSFYVHDEILGSEIVTEGIVIDDPDIREQSQKLIIEEDISGIITKILVTTDFSQEFNYGNKVSIKGIVEKPENFVTDQGKVFDYVNYLKKDGIFYTVSYPEIEVLSAGYGNKLKTALFAIKNKFLEKINFVIPSPENVLMGGLILGEKSAFSEELREDFVDTGTIHIVALSGYNVTIVAEWIMRIFNFLPVAIGFGAGMLGILLFVVMAGGQSTAVRAGVMAVLVLVARATGRGYDVARALLLVGVVMILFNPYVLAFDVSFQLSFVATVAVIFFTPKIEKYFLWAPKRFGLRDVISVTCAAYIFVLPFILYKMGSLSLVAIPVNILILPLIPAIMLLGFLAGALGLVWYAFSVPVGYAASLLLGYQLSVVEFLARVPFAALSIPNFPLVLTILIYTYFIYKLFGGAIKKYLTEPF